MNIQFEDKLTIYSFNETELEELDHLYQIFKNYGNIDLKTIRIALSTEFAVKIIPFFYKVYKNMIRNIKIDLPKQYLVTILQNKNVYVEYGLLMKWYCDRRHSNMLPDDIPDYLMNEINNYEIINIGYGRRVLGYRTPTDLYMDLYIDNTVLRNRPYESDIDIAFVIDMEEKYW